MTDSSRATLSFTCDLDDRAIYEIEQKGYFEHALVNLPDGSAVRVCFWDPVRLAQDLETNVKLGKNYIAEPGLIVLPRISVRNMTVAVEDLYQRGYFDRLRSLFRA